ncbi:MAG: fumarate hydratase, partial [Clostridia bacterium]|nr:fumarate hydratase [Clostridia bacterium]
MRTIDSKLMTQTVRDLFLSAAKMPGSDALRAIESAHETETCAPSKQALAQLIDNARISGETGMPYCQDTGMAVVFIDVGQDVHIDGDITAAVNEGVRGAYKQGYFRMSVLDPLTRQNTLDNTPAVIHFNIVPGDKI